MDDDNLDFIDFDEYDVDFTSMAGDPLRGEETFSPQLDTTDWQVDVRVDLNQDQQQVPMGTSGACFPTAPPNNTDTFVWGSVAGACQWIDTTTCS